MNEKKVLLALSGGVDSSVAALLLQKQGYEVIAATMDTGFGESPDEAAAVAEQLGIEHHIVDVRQDFSCFVIDDFIREYNAAHTPNPCVVCNPTVKFAFMECLADELGINKIATGHYARISQYNGRFAVRKAKQLAKDQSYVLYRLSQQLLSRLILPLGDYDKQEIRAMAAEFSLSISDKPDSQDICFIPDGDYRSFLQQNGVEFQKGDFVDLAGKVIGKHQGLQCYTVGQRKGLGIALGYPAYVCALDAEKNQVVLGREEDLNSDSCLVENIEWQGAEAISEPVQITVKLRYKSSPIEAVLIPQGKNCARLNFKFPQKSVTPGQSAVFYDGEIVLGGGIIA
ncbi:MAG: tRNA 2-thiouridine(34) synthase MnmA [Firmicutes bacterium]|nr:tRNA 2-thiouridine(34) synthase MnmA [Bacillota bacterium]